jgi:hypothetical protein
MRLGGSGANLKGSARVATLEEWEFRGRRKDGIFFQLPVFYNFAKIFVGN